MAENILTAAGGAEDLALDQTLRPRRFEDFIGQERIKENLRIYIEAARRRKEPLDHILFSGPPGLGKTTLATILAHEMGAEMIPTSGPVIEKAGDLAGLLTKLRKATCSSLTKFIASARPSRSTSTRRWRTSRLTS